MAITDAGPEITGAEDIRWDLDPLIDGGGRDAVLSMLDDGIVEAKAIKEASKGTVASLDAQGLADLMRRFASMQERISRAGNFASLKYSVDTADPANGALLQQVREKAAAMSTELVWISLEWAALDDEHVEKVLADPVLDFCAYSLRSDRRYKDHLLTEPEEQILTEKSVTGSAAFTRLFSEQTSAIEVDLGDQGGTVTLDGALSRLSHPDREVRAHAQNAVTDALRPGLRTRAFIFNTLAADKATDDRLRDYNSWIASRNLSNEASDDSVQALIDAVVSRYDIPQRWYALKAKVLGLDRLADYDRSASIAESDTVIPWDDARNLVLDAYQSFSPDLADVVKKFFDNEWIDAPAGPGKRGGAFCAYTVPSHHPYVFLNYTARQRDVLTLAHELGHAVHGYLARPQGIFHMTTPLTLAETASVFGETVTFEKLLGETTDPTARFALLANQLEDSIATVFRQTAMNRFEHEVHTHRRTQGELSVDDFAGYWRSTQEAMLGDAVEVTENYDMWWSYIPHFINTPGYVYAYAYGQLLALSVYARYRDEGETFVPKYLNLLASGGSMPPEELGKIVGCDLADPEFWVQGLDLVAGILARAEAAAPS